MREDNRGWTYSQEKVLLCIMDSCFSWKLQVQMLQWWMYLLQKWNISLDKMLIDGLEFCGLLADYCDVLNSYLDSHSDGTHSLQRIHWWASDALLDLSKSVLMKKQTHLHLYGLRVNTCSVHFYFQVNYFKEDACRQQELLLVVGVVVVIISFVAFGRCCVQALWCDTCCCWWILLGAGGECQPVRYMPTSLVVCYRETGGCFWSLNRPTWRLGPVEKGYVRDPSCTAEPYGMSYFLHRHVIGCQDTL